MKRTLISIILACATIATNAQDHSKAIRDSAQIMANATLKGDYSTTVRFMYPKLVELAGGRDSLVSFLIAGV